MSKRFRVCALPAHSLSGAQHANDWSQPQEHGSPVTRQIIVRVKGEEDVRAVCLLSELVWAVTCF